MTIWALFQYPIRYLSVTSHSVLKPRDLYLELYTYNCTTALEFDRRFVSSDADCRHACKISKWCDDLQLSFLRLWDFSRSDDKMSLRVLKRAQIFIMWIPTPGKTVFLQVIGETTIPVSFVLLRQVPAAHLIEFYKILSMA